MCVCVCVCDVCVMCVMCVGECVMCVCEYVMCDGGIWCCVCARKWRIIAVGPH